MSAGIKLIIYSEFFCVNKKKQKLSAYPRGGLVVRDFKGGKSSALGRLLIQEQACGFYYAQKRTLFSGTRIQDEYADFRPKHGPS